MLYVANDNVLNLLKYLTSDHQTPARKEFSELSKFSSIECHLEMLIRCDLDRDLRGIQRHLHRVKQIV